jgi:NAD(P)-dependent dehydrogenase (short-subunit alcohol dehydrogenase family)
MERRTILVTGATDGIGKATATALSAEGAKVVILARNEAKARAAALAIRAASAPDAVVDFIAADLSSQQEVRRAAAEYKSRYDRLDVLVNNAGVLSPERHQTRDGLEETFAVNHLGYFLLVQELLDILKASAPARIVNVSSESHRHAKMAWGDLQFASHRYEPWRAYGQSKLANILFTYELARRLEGSGVTANALHPGVVGTGFGQTYGGPTALLVRLARPFLATPAEGARTSIYLASSPEVEGVTGRYFVKSRAVGSSELSYCKVSQKKLWSISEELTRPGAKPSWASAPELFASGLHAEELSGRRV